LLAELDIDFFCHKFCLTRFFNRGWAVILKLRYNHFLYLKFCKFALSSKVVLVAFQNLWDILFSEFSVCGQNILLPFDNFIQACVFSQVKTTIFLRRHVKVFQN